MGAMSPGPSLALVLRHTLSGGRGNGVAAALAHAHWIHRITGVLLLALALRVIMGPLAG